MRETEIRDRFGNIVDDDVVPEGGVLHAKMTLMDQAAFSPELKRAFEVAEDQDQDEEEDEDVDLDDDDFYDEDEWQQAAIDAYEDRKKAMQNAYKAPAISNQSWQEMPKRKLPKPPRRKGFTRDTDFDEEQAERQARRAYNQRAAWLADAWRHPPQQNFKLDPSANQQSSHSAPQCAQNRDAAESEWLARNRRVEEAWRQK